MPTILIAESVSVGFRADRSNVTYRTSESDSTANASRHHRGYLDAVDHDTERFLLIPASLTCLPLADHRAARRC
jgi:hypothetical protein